MSTPQHIITELAAMNFVKRVYVSLDGSSDEEFPQARKIIKPLADKGVLLWNDSPNVQAVLEKIGQAVPLGDRGKGRAVWRALGYALGKGEVSVLAFHRGAYGYLINATVERGAIERIISNLDGGVIRLRCSVPEGVSPEGGLTVYGAESGRYPVCPTLLFEWKAPDKSS